MHHVEMHFEILSPDLVSLQTNNTDGNPIPVKVPVSVLLVFGSDRSPRRGDLVRAYVRACGIFCKITVKMSSRSILKSPGGY